MMTSIRYDEINVRNGPLQDIIKKHINVYYISNSDEYGNIFAVRTNMYE